MEFSTFDTDVYGRCTNFDKGEASGNWWPDTEDCGHQSMTGPYNGGDKGNGVYFFWYWDRPLKTVQLMVRPVAES